MTKGQHLTKHQQGIVNRYYANLDTITLTKLQELVTEIYLASNDKARAKLWERVDTALAKTDLDALTRTKIMNQRDVKALAEMVHTLSKK
jgi:hypothetical protein